MTTLVYVCLGVTCCLLVGLVLLQRGRGGGVSSLVGGGHESAFGRRTGDALTWATVTAFVFLIALAGVASRLSN